MDKKKEMWKKVLIIIGAIILGIICLFYYIFCNLYKDEIKTYQKMRMESILNDNQEEERKQEILTYLGERYGEDFEIVSFKGRSYAKDYVQAYVQPTMHPDAKHEFQVQGRKVRHFLKKEFEYVDGYVMVKLSDDYAAGMDEVIDEYFDDYKFFLEFNSEWMTNELPANTKVEDLFQLRCNVDYPMPTTCIFFKKSQMKKFQKENIMEMASVLAEWGYKGELWVLCYSDDDFFYKKTYNNYKTYLDGERGCRDSHWVFIEGKEKIMFDEVIWEWD